MKNKLKKIGFGGGCHWCTEAVFQHLKGVEKVEQGWIASSNESETFSEAVIVHYNSEEIPLKVLTEIHLRTHKSTALHSMRKKYRSAIYSFSKQQEKELLLIFKELQSKFDKTIITKIIPFISFKPNTEQFKDYYKKNPQKPFCETFINPKLQLLLRQFSHYAKTEDLQHLKTLEDEKQ